MHGIKAKQALFLLLRFLFKTHKVLWSIRCTGFATTADICITFLLIDKKMKRWRRLADQWKETKRTRRRIGVKSVRVIGENVCLGYSEQTSLYYVTVARTARVGYPRGRPFLEENVFGFLFSLSEGLWRKEAYVLTIAVLMIVILASAIDCRFRNNIIVSVFRFPFETSLAPGLNDSVYHFLRQASGLKARLVLTAWFSFKRCCRMRISFTEGIVPTYLLARPPTN